MTATESILRFIPRKGLYIIIAGLVSTVVWLGRARVVAAENASLGAQTKAEEARIKALEADAKAARALAIVIENTIEIRSTRETVEEMRRDTLEYFRWQAQQAGDWRRENRYASRLRELPKPSEAH